MILLECFHKQNQIDFSYFSNNFLILFQNLTFFLLCKPTFANFFIVSFYQSIFYLGKGGGAKASAGANVQDARKEMTKTKEQLEEEKKISLAIRYGILLPKLF